MSYMFFIRCKLQYIITTVHLYTICDPLIDIFGESTIPTSAISGQITNTSVVIIVMFVYVIFTTYLIRDYNFERIKIFQRNDTRRM